MQRTQIVSCIKKAYDEGVLNEIDDDGPTSILLTANGKSYTIGLKLTKAGDSVIATFGRFFKRRYVILLSELIG